MPENTSQFPNIDNSSKKTEAIIGFDFGTSSSKIIIHLPFSTGTPAFAVPFGSFADPNLEYLLPTRLFVDENSGACSLNSDDADAIEFAAIKIGLMRDSSASIKSVDGLESKFSAECVATAYIALALRYIRCWFIDSHYTYEDTYLKWSFNLGLPAAKDDEDEPRNSFMRVGKAAWLASMRAGAVTIDSAKVALAEVKSDASEYELEINFRLLPEVIAEIQCYREARVRSDGLHVLIDVGATTLDINGFLLNNEADARAGKVKNYTIILADVENFGSMILHKGRIEVAKNNCDDKRLHSHLEKFELDDTTQIVPKDLNDYIPSDFDETKASDILRALEVLDDNFRINKAFYNYIARMLDLLRTDKNPFLKRWEDLPWNRIRIILCGGASVIPLYEDLVNVEINEWLKRYVRDDFSVRLVQLPMPESLETDIAADDFHRLAVAYGLSFPDYDIGDYSRPSEVDLQRETKVINNDDNYIGSSQV